MRNNGPLLAFGLCCIWPVVFHFAWVFIAGAIQRRDWTNIRWDELKLPWSKGDK